jgi:hypothetical protein
MKIGSVPTLDVLFHHQVTPQTETLLLDIPTYYLSVGTEDSPRKASKLLGFFWVNYELTCCCV